MPHVLHACAKAPEGAIESLKENYGWDSDELPINTDAPHEKCPYCGIDLSDRENVHAATGQQVRMLGRRPRKY